MPVEVLTWWKLIPVIVTAESWLADLLQMFPVQIITLLPLNPNILHQISWFHNTTFITYSGPRPGVSMITDKSPSSVLVSLIISAAETEDSGTYFCRRGGEYYDKTFHKEKAFNRKLGESSLTKLRTAGLQTRFQMQTSQWMCWNRQTTQQCWAEPALKVLWEVTGNFFVLF